MNPQIIAVNTITAAALPSFTHYALIVIVNSIATSITGLCLTTSAKVIVVDTAATATAIPGFAQYALIVVIDAVATGKCLTTKTKH
ncbi:MULTISPECIES: hypothetical protein [unclassified Pseudomonas]|uniref:hypothetical protein n=1 Tax=unclassified Pseudomonas TaxID=196821 RepID=UPI001CC1824E|nr:MULTISPECIES: hypothetical protein [unclassified Pseudomonas]